MLRLRRAVPVDPAALLLLEQPLDDVPPEERGLTSRETRRLRVALAGLPAEQRRAFALAALLGRTAREISQIEDAPLGTIKTRIRTAMLKLHAELEVEDR